MENSILFITIALISFSACLIAFYFGKKYVFAYIAFTILLMNIFVIKGMYIFGIATAGGNALYAGIFLATDILNEHYGRKEAQKAVWLGFVTSLLYIVLSQLFLRMTPSGDEFAQTAQSALETIFGFAPRVFIGSMSAYLISQSLDVYLFRKIKELSGDKMLWLRNNVSTIISQFVDTVIFTLIVFWGVYSSLWQFILFAYLIKVSMAILDTPFIYLSKLIHRKKIG